MSKNKPSKKKVVVSTKKKGESTKKVDGSKTKRRTATPKTKSGSTAKQQNTRPLTFGPETYKWMGIGIGLIFLGLFLMTGGGMPDPDTWDPNRIYGFRRTVLAPFLMLAGLGIQIYAIFKK